MKKILLYLKELSKLSLKAKIDLPRYSILTPFPKTQFYAQLEAENRIFEKNWAMYDVEHCVFTPKKMTVEELEKGTAWAWRETYSMKNIFKDWLHSLIVLGYHYL